MLVSAKDSLRPCYLISGDDEAKVGSAIARLLARAESEGGAVERISASEGTRAPDPEDLSATLAAIPLATGWRYVLVDGVEAWLKADVESASDALRAIPPETTVALVARGKLPKGLEQVVASAGGESLAYSAPSERELPARLVADAAREGISLTPEAARMLVERLGARPLRLRNEVARLAVWAPEGATVDVDDVATAVADDSELEIWALGDALAVGDLAGSLTVADRLIAQGEALQRIVATLAPRMRAALKAALALESGVPPKRAAEGLRMHPYAARKLVEAIEGRDPAELAVAVEAVADLEVASRTGIDGPLALTLGIRRACGAEWRPGREARAAV